MFDVESGQFIAPQNLNLNRMTHGCAAWGNKIAVGGGWRAEQTVTTGHIEILTDSTIVFSSAEALSPPKLSVFPNPVSQHLTIQFSEYGYETNKAEAILFDPSGRVALQQILTSNLTRMDLSQFQPGMYFLKVNNSQNWQIEKVIVH